MNLLAPGPNPHHRRVPGLAPAPRRSDAPLETLETIVLISQCTVNALVFARSCRDRGIAVYLLEVTGGAPRWPAFSAALSGGTAMPAARLSTPEGLARIVEYAASVGAGVLAADISVDRGYLIEHRAALEKTCRLVAPTADGRAIEGDKVRQIELARAVGFPVLPTWLLRCPADLDAIPDEAFPICVRPQNLRLSPWFKVLVMHDRAALRVRLEATDFAGTAIIAQPFLNVPNLKVHGVRSVSGEILALRAFCVSRKFQGVTLSLQPARLPDAIAQSSREFVERCGVVGCFQFDLLWSQDAAYFLEINPRPGGTTDKVRWLGFDEPSLTLAAYGFRGPAEQPPAPAPAFRTVVSKRTVLKHIAAAARNELTELDYPGGSRLRHILQSCRELVWAKDSVFDWRDLRGSFWYHARSSGRHSKA